MPTVNIVYGEEEKNILAESGSLLGDVIVETGLPLEQPCAGRGTCGLCNVIAEKGLAPPDEVEQEHLTPGEMAVGNRLACRARIKDDTRILLAPIVVYSNKIFRSSSRYKRKRDVPLGLAIDLGSTTVAAFLTMLDNGEVCAGAASLNQQTVYGADVISRLAAALEGRENARRLQKLALASINQAIDALKLSEKIRQRVQRVTIVGNPAMHHLLTLLPIKTLARIPFQPLDKSANRDATEIMGGIFPQNATVALPPLIGGFVGSDALACLAYFGFAEARGPIAAIDLGTNGEVMVSDGERILTASTAAGPAFEGVNISCGMRAVDGAITSVQFQDGQFTFETIADEPPLGLTGSGLITAIHQLRQAGGIDDTGRMRDHPPLPDGWMGYDRRGMRFFHLVEDGSLRLSQMDVRELQKAKGAIRAAVDLLMANLDLRPDDLDRLVLTGSFGGQVNIDAALGLGMIPPVRKEIVETVANGAGFGAAMFLSDEGFALGERLAQRAQQFSLDQDSDFYKVFLESMSLAP